MRQTGDGRMRGTNPIELEHPDKLIVGYRGKYDAHHDCGGGISRPLEQIAEGTRSEHQEHVERRISQRKGAHDRKQHEKRNKIARGNAECAGKPVSADDMRIRVTEAFRRIDGDWKMIHRHADVPN